MTKILKIYIFVLIYTSVLRLFLGKWGTLIFDVFTVGLFVYCLFKTKGIFRISKNEKYIFIAIVILQILSMIEIFNGNITNTLYSIIEYRKSYFQIFLVIPIIVLLNKKRIDFIEIIKFIGIISVPVIAYGIKQHYLWSSIDNKFLDLMDSDMYTMQYAGASRSSSIFSGPFHYGLFCVILFALYVFLILKNEKKVGLIGIVCSFTGVICSATRTNIVCLISLIIITYLFYLNFKKGKKSIVIKLTTIFGIVLMSMSILVGVIDTSSFTGSFWTLLNSLTNISSDTRFAGRFGTWEQAIEYIKQNPILGWGIGSSADTMSKYGISKIYVTSHNMYLKIWMEIGLLGFFSYVYIFGKFFKCNIKKYKNDYAIKLLVCSLFLCIFINSLVGSTLPSFPCMSLFWIVNALLLASNNKNFSSR